MGSTFNSESLVHLPIIDYVWAEIVINAVMVGLTLIVVFLRMLGRLLGPGLGWDDAFVLLATPLGVGMLVCQGLFAPIGNGYPMADHPELIGNVPFILKLTFGMQIIYVVLLASVKISMLCFFLRVFVDPVVQRAAKVTLGLVVMWAIAFLCSCIFLCNPISAQWNSQGTCGKYIPMIQSLIATNALGDLVIMIIPMRCVWGLKTRNVEKMGITACFALGTICIVCAIFRLVYISTVNLNSNVTGTMPTTVFLFTLEPNLSVLCVSIPMLLPFYTRYKKRAGGSRLDDNRTPQGANKGLGYINHLAGRGRSSGRAAHRPEDVSAWELEDYENLHEGKEGSTSTGRTPLVEK